MEKIKINIKPLSVNEGYTGKRWKTPEHRTWERSVLFMLPPKIKMPDPPFKIFLNFGFSSPASDWDNGIKFACDTIAKKYQFNDKLIRAGNINTELVAKGNEFFEFYIENYENRNSNTRTLI